MEQLVLFVSRSFKGKKRTVIEVEKVKKYLSCTFSEKNWLVPT